jgi:hypothetical protein
MGLDRISSRPSDLASLTIYLVDLGDYRAHGAGIGAVWRRMVGRNNPAMARAPRIKHAAGTRNGWQTLKGGFLPPRAAARRADIAAIDRGEARRVACLFRGLYPPYSARFQIRKMDLTPDAVILRPFWYSPDRHIVRISETVTAAYTRARDPVTDHRIRSFGNYETGRPLGYAGFTVVVCETPRGRLEFAVPNPDLPLVLHYFHRGTAGDVRSGTTEQTSQPGG